MHKEWTRPHTAAELMAWSDSPEAFGRNLRDWQHELRRVHSRPAFLSRVNEAPELIRRRLRDGGVADAYIAAYVDYLCGEAGVEAPEWVYDSKRVAEKAWYDTTSLWKQLLVLSPSEFRVRHLFTVPDNVLKIRPGRPRVTSEQKRQKCIERQRRYRRRVQEKLRRLEALEAKG